MRAGWAYFVLSQQAAKDFRGFAKTKLPMRFFQSAGEVLGRQVNLVASDATGDRSELTPDIGSWRNDLVFGARKCFLGACRHTPGTRAGACGAIVKPHRLSSSEVPALTIPGHVTIYRYQPEGLPEVPASFAVCLVVGVGIFRPETFGPSHALKGD